MRELKFKAYDRRRKEWVANGDILNLYHSASCDAFMFDNDNYDLGHRDIEFYQFIGVKDKNGRDICEGDIVRRNGFSDVDDYQEQIHEVSRHVVSLDVFRFWVKGEAFGWERENLIEPEECEVIGNIYDTPHLLAGAVSPAKEEE